jgi:hypothetical protein
MSLHPFSLPKRFSSRFITRDKAQRMRFDRQKVRIFIFVMHRIFLTNQLFQCP